MATTETNDTKVVTNMDDDQPQVQADCLTLEVKRLQEKLKQAESGPRRKRLPTTRQSVTHKFSISGHEGYLTVGHYDDGKPGELFIKMAKEGSTISGLMDTIAILTSLALQYGVPVDSLARKFQHSRFEPSGHTNNPDLAVASSVSDYVFSWLGLRYSEEFRNERATQSGLCSP
jgi:ribonucleoside-diphosphate reductase alpha chain